MWCGLIHPYGLGQVRSDRDPFITVAPSTAVSKAAETTTFLFMAAFTDR